MSFFIDESFYAWFKDIWVDLAVELIDVFEVRVFEVLFTVVRAVADGDIIYMKVDPYGSVEINERVFGYLLKNFTITVNILVVI